LPSIQTRDDLANVLQKYPNDREGNINAAVFLWRYKYGNRLQQLHELLAYFDSIGVTDQQGLKRWEKESDFDRDFKGRVKGLAFAVYKVAGNATGVPKLLNQIFTLKVFSERLLGDRLPIMKPFLFPNVWLKILGFCERIGLE